MTPAGRQVLLATRSAGKIRELIPMVRGAGFEPVTLVDAGIPESPAEDEVEHFETFEENALAKARYFSSFPAARGRAVLADDSGLSVDALGGAPGVRSKRWSAAPDLSGQALDDANNRKLMHELAPHADRRAGYVCVAAVVTASPTREILARGECRGSILHSPSGSGGFGYDPYFFSEELEQSFGDASLEAKARVSHRARAFAIALERLSRE